MIAQLELFNKRKISQPASKIAARMIAVLAKRPIWTTRKDFEQAGLSDRECRAGRKASHGRIISGQRGYILMRDAKPDEIAESRAQLVSMKRELEREITWIDRRSHGALAGTECVK